MHLALSSETHVCHFSGICFAYFCMLMSMLRLGFSPSQDFIKIHGF